MTELAGLMKWLGSNFAATTWAVNLDPIGAITLVFTNHEPQVCLWVWLSSYSVVQVEVLARAHALLLQTGLSSWVQLEQYAMKPFHPQTFWKHANTLYRHLTVFFLAHALQVSPFLTAMDPVKHVCQCC